MLSLVLKNMLKRLLVLIAILSLAGCNKINEQATATAPAPRPEAARAVKTTAVIEMAVERAVTVTGTLAAYDQATVSVKAPGRLKEIKVDLGTLVRQGQLIALVDPQDYQLRLAQTEAVLAQARARLGLAPDSSLESFNPEQVSIVRQAKAVLDEAETRRTRLSQLLKQGVISQADYDAADAAYKVAESRYQDAIEEVHNRRAQLSQRVTELAIARQQLADTAIYAPFDGVIQEKRASVGEFLGQSAPVATIMRINPLRLRAEVPEREAARARIGQTVRVTVDGDSKSYTGRIMRLSPSISAQNRMLIVEAEIENNGGLRPGGFARAEIITEDKSPALAVPRTAIITFAGIEKVLVNDKGKAAEKLISTGRKIGEMVEVISGIKPGDEVIVEPGNLQPGQPVVKE